MIFALMLPLLLVNFISIYIDYKIKSPFFSFSSATLLVFTLPNIGYSLLGKEYSTDTILIVTLCGTLFLLSYSILRLGFTYLINKRISQININNSDDDISIQIKISAVCLVIFLLISMYGFNFSIKSMMISSWSEWREQASYIDLLGGFLFFIGSSLTLMIIKYDRKKYIPLILIITLYVVFVLKTRNYLVTLFGPAIIYYILHKKINCRFVLTGLLLIGVFFMLYSAARDIRHIGSIEKISHYNGEFEFDRGEFELVKTLYFFVEKGGVDDETPFPTILRLSLLPIPSVILPFEKPKELSHILWNEKMGVMGVSGSLHVTAIGDSILNQKYVGWLFFSLLYAMLFTCLDLLLRKFRFGFILFGVFSVVGFYMARGAVYNGFIILLITGFIFTLFSLIFRMKIIRR